MPKWYIFGEFLNFHFFWFEKKLIFKNNSQIFERRELTKRTLSSAYKGLCEYIITMKDLETSKVEFFENPNDFVLSFALLFEIPQIQPMNHNFAKVLRSMYQNRKFANTSQEFIGLFISRYLKI